MTPNPQDFQEIRDARLADFETRGRDIYNLNTQYVTHHKARIERIKIIDNITDGKWDVVFPDNVARQGRAMVADSITSDLNDVMLLAGGVDPTVICDPRPKRKGASMEDAIEKAQLRQQILVNHRRRSHLSRKRRQLAIDLAGAGMACLVVWPDLPFRGGVYEMNPSEPRYPLYLRKDPRTCFPDPDCKDGSELLNMTVSYRVKARQLAADYPWVVPNIWTTQELARSPKEAANTELTVIEYHDGILSGKVAVLDKSTAGRKDVRLTALAVLEHNIGTPLAVFMMRPTFDGQIRGQFDTAVAPLGAANEMYTLAIEGFDRLVHSKELWIGEFENPEDDSPGARIMGREGSRIDRVAPDAVNPQVFAFVAQSLEMARSSAGIPAARSGEGLPSIISAQGVDRVQGKLTSQIADYQDIMSDGEERANQLAFAVDEKCMGGTEKPISGSMNGKVFQRTYIPERDINGEYDNRVEFGAGAGLDHRNRLIDTIQLAQVGFISKRKARTEVSTDEDIEEMERDVYREKTDEAIFAGLAETPSPEQWMEAMRMRLRVREMFDEGRSIGDIAKEILSEPVAVPAVPEPGMPPPAEAVQTALEKGGGPNSPTLRSLPDLGIRRPGAA